MPDTNALKEYLLQNGARAVGEIAVADIPFHREFRAACESNTCGRYGTNWCCPPACGDIDELMARAGSYERALVFQSIFPLEDSFDIEGMSQAAASHNGLTRSVAKLAARELPGCLVLGAGGCDLCRPCAKATDEPCRHPGEQVVSLEAYGVAVSELAPLVGMNYINGANTVTYFSVIFY